jgi:hypothetical protein
MLEENRIAWIAGILEGEGSFIIRPNGGILICCTMTDFDVLERIQKSVGGSIYTHRRKQKEYHKSSWTWNIYGEKAYTLTKQILPYLLSRRSEKAYKMMKTYENSNRVKAKNNQEKIKHLYKERNLTHKTIAEMFKISRSYVSHILNGRYD